MRKPSNTPFEEMIAFPLWKLESHLIKLYALNDYLHTLKAVDVERLDTEILGAIAVGASYVDALQCDFQQALEKATGKEAKND